MDNHGPRGQRNGAEPPSDAKTNTSLRRLMVDQNRSATHFPDMKGWFSTAWNIPHSSWLQRPVRGPSYSASIRTLPALEAGGPPTVHRVHSCRTRTPAPVFHSRRMQTSTIGYPDEVKIFVFIEASVACGPFNPETQEFSTGSHICFAVVVAGPANKLRAEVAIKIIAENISFSRGC